MKAPLETDPETLDAVGFALSNFATVSALATALAAAVCVSCLGSYLFVFDPSLIWLIDSSDILKVSITGLAFASILIAFLVGAASLLIVRAEEDFTILLGVKWNFPRLAAVAITILLCIIFLVQEDVRQLYMSWRSLEFAGRFFDILNIIIPIIFSMLTLPTLVVVKRFPRMGLAIKIRILIGIWVALNVAFVLMGSYKKYYAKFDHVVTVKVEHEATENIGQASIVISLNRYLILITRKEITAVPIDSVVRITAVNTGVN